MWSSGVSDCRAVSISWRSRDLTRIAAVCSAAACICSTMHAHVLPHQQHDPQSMLAMHLPLSSASSYFFLLCLFLCQHQPKKLARRSAAGAGRDGTRPHGAGSFQAGRGRGEEGAPAHPLHRGQEPPQVGPWLPWPSRKPDQHQSRTPLCPQAWTAKWLSSRVRMMVAGAPAHLGASHKGYAY